MNAKSIGRAARAAFAVSLALVMTLVVAGCAQPGGDTSGTPSSDESYSTVTPGKLTVVSDLANPPFDYMDGDMPTGFEVDLMNALASKMGLEVEYLSPLKFDSIVPTIQQGGKADVGASNFTITEERLQSIDFTDAYIDSNQGLVTSADISQAVSSDVSSLNTPSTQVAVQAGTTGESWVKENLPSATVVSLDDPIQALTGVQTGLYKAAVADLPVMQYEVKSAYTGLSVAMEIPTGEQYGLVVSKDNPGLTKALNKALQECREDGTLSQLETKWFGEDYESEGSDAAATATQATTASGNAGSIDVNKATARPNESGGDGVIGGMNTRLTWEGTVNVDDGVSSVTLSLPEGSTFDGSTTRVTVLDGLNRINVDSETSTDGSSVTIKFKTPVPSGSLLRLEITDMQFPAEGGDFVVSGSYVTGAGTQGALDDSPSISIIANTPVQAIVNYLDGQTWVEAWNSVPFLNMFFKPQLLVTSFVSLFNGWLLCLLLVVIAYPFAIALGLLFAIMKISNFRIARVIAAIYINVLRGTPLFLQIYIMFFGLPMMGINIDNNVLGVIVIAINSSAYQAEIFRAGIQSIPNGQYEAAASLGMNRAQTMFTVILPQMVRRVIPTVTSDFITSYKDTSLLSSVGVMELMMFSKNLTTVSGNITPYMAAAIYYLIVTIPLIKAVGVVEGRMAAAENGGGPRPKAGAKSAGASSKAQTPEPASMGYHAEEKDTASVLGALSAPFRAHSSKEA
ncbi:MULTISPECIES: ABC transporter permease subunit [Atopobiaceae]|uniref:Polar amino acid transport system substrate-binding protein n=1 Tax=Parafannyhessea umbonata TaxID=604330 RepID=A0A1H6HTD2_9ACTN|nr:MULTISPECIES: ABC transporter permease subunit [Atopobiaceae]SEH37400.1 polar amino acid transport system substrate-binding protein [Parafannyhessea umbonata]SJZ39499.1 polar amino acid transport system substrate-binding protein [Olsenella sp. KH1P3]